MNVRAACLRSPLRLGVGIISPGVGGWTGSGDTVGRNAISLVADSSLQSANAQNSRYAVLSDRVQESIAQRCVEEDVFTQGFRSCDVAI
jgi:hypothetical protein